MLPRRNHLLCLPWFLIATGFAAEINFNRDIRPILSDKCFACHGPDEHERKADLRLDTYEGATEGGEFAIPIEPGNPEESEVIARIFETDPDEIMPPPKSHKKLTAKEKELLRQWIAEGAKYDPPWAYVPPTRHPVPAVTMKDWPVNWIDRFLLANLEREKLSPSPDADPVTLLRRLHFDLTGLPPAPADVDAFVGSDIQDPSASGGSKIEATVDRLLASPAFGERLAIYWLDLVRYADTVGYHGDQDHNISPYRDYVIDAFNANLPFDQFTREQLAGDLLPDPTIDQKIASGYNRLLQTTHEGGAQPKEYLSIYLADRVRNVSAVWMGATVGCAQCHDHKYDPYTAKDHYSLGAFFADIDEDQHFKVGTNALPTKRPPEMRVFTAEQQARMAGTDARIDSLAGKNRGKLEQLVMDEGRLEGEINKARNEEKKAQSEEQKEKLKQKGTQLTTTLEEVRAKVAEHLSPEAWKQFKSLLAARQKQENEGILTMITVAKEPRPVRILPRGNWLDDSGPVVEPAYPEFLVPADRKSQIADRAERLTRLDLANWLTDPEHGVGGLTARVFVNRLWALFFGTGIARDLGDFGGQGQAPVHPELLNNLAVEFYEAGWDVKHLVKLMVTSRAYRQSSLASPELRDRDPHNQLVARQSRFRLPAEMMRDNALAISGLLVDEHGGPSAKPYQPAGYYRHLNFPQRKYSHHSDQRQWRRGVYVHWQRQFLHPMLKAFDAPTREECTAERPQSNTPIAAMTLLNDPSFLEAARVFAERIIREGGKGNKARLDFAWRLAVSRTPDEEERKIMGKLFAIAESEFKVDHAAAKKLVSIGQAPVPDDLDPGEHATWTTVARAILNLSETYTRN